MNIYYTWSNGKLVSFTDAENITHNYSYDNTGKITSYNEQTVTYAGDRVKSITQPNGAFVKYAYNDTANRTDGSNYGGKGAVTVCDSKGVTDIWYYSDGFSVTNSLDSYTDSAVYAPEAEITLPQDNFANTAYSLSDIYQVGATDAPEDEKTEDVEVPKYIKNKDGSYTIYFYHENSDKISTVFEIPKDTITVNENTTYADAYAVAEKYTYYAYNYGRLTQINECEKSEFGALQIMSETYYRYRSNGNLYSVTRYENLNTKPLMTYEELYDENENLLMIYSYLKENNAKKTVVLYTYNDNNDLLSQTIQEGFETEYLTDTEKITYTYNSNNDLLTKITQKRIGTAGLANTEKIEYLYTQNGNIASYTESEWLAGEWCAIYNEVSTYDLYGNTISSEIKKNTNTVNIETNLVETQTVLRRNQNHFDAYSRLSGTTENVDTDYETETVIVYDKLGRVASQSFDNGTVSFSYNNRSAVTSMTSSNKTTTYTYGENGNLISATHPDGTVTGYVYDSVGNLTSRSCNGYLLRYNTLGNITEAKIGDQTIVSYIYSPDVEQNVMYTVYGNNQAVNYVYDGGDITNIKLGNDVKYSYAYTKDENNITISKTITDMVSGLIKNMEDSKLTVKNLNNQFIYSVEYKTKTEADENSFNGMIEKADYETYTTRYYDDYDRFDGAYSYYKKTYERNGDGRIAKTAVVCGLNDQYVSLLTRYEYNQNNFISRLKNTVADDTYTYDYTYDSNGNIITETLTSSEGSVQTEYSYDSKNQLTKVENPDKKYEYSYDGRGNLIGKTESAVTLDESNEKIYTEIKADSYVYDETWQDKLINYNGQTVAYDASGNPTSYLGHNLSWTMGRQLASYDNINYTYNEDGIRTSKTSNEQTTLYYLDGTRLIETFDGVNRIHLNYDQNGEAMGFTHFYFGECEGEDPIATNYTYIKNAQGDIVGFSDIFGNVKAKYTYDPWGKLIGTESRFSRYEVDVTQINPLRYRGYIYDNETGLYYLQSRYYDPEIGRFINCDDVNYLGVSESELSYNAFAYCVNNPANRYDYYGRYSSLESGLDTFLFSVTIVGLLESFLQYLLKNINYTIKEKTFKIDNNGLYSIDVKYKEKVLSKTMKLIFGDYDGWKNSIDPYNRNTKIYYDYYVKHVSDEVMKHKYGALYLFFMTNVALLGTIIGSNISASKAKKVYNPIWGTDGIDHANNNNIIAVYVSKAGSKYNGIYYYNSKRGNFIKI